MCCALVALVFVPASATLARSSTIKSTGLETPFTEATHIAWMPTGASAGTES